MKTLKLFTHVMIMSVVLAAVTACSGQKEGKASFRNRGSRAGVNAPTNVRPGQPATTNSNYGIIQGYNQAAIENFLGAEQGAVGQVFQSGTTDTGVFIVGRLRYSQNGQMLSDSAVQIIVRDQNYQQLGGEFQSDFGNCSDAFTSGNNILVTCIDSAGQIVISGTLMGNQLNASITFTTNGFAGGGLGQFTMPAAAILSN